MTTSAKRWTWIIAAFLIANLIAAVSLACVAGSASHREVPGYSETR